jgi:nitrite reductase/ring-hydroxylating ferredoxin subunit
MTMNASRNVSRAEPAAGAQWTIPKRSFVSREYAELERERLWPRVWQLACREEELASVGSYVVYDILDDSIIVIRTSQSQIKAYNNACLHRGRRLADQPCGHKAKFVCRFHGWRWKLDGSNEYVHELDDWNGELDQSTLRLREFKVGQWGGFVFVNMDPECQPFEDFIAPVAEILNPMELEKQRYRWYISVEVDANWKVCQAAFQETYHVAATHPQFESFSDSRSILVTHGPHAQVRYPPLAEAKPGRHGIRPFAGDGRHKAVEYFRMLARDIESLATERDFQAVARVLDMPESTTYMEALAKGRQYIVEAANATGAGYPSVTPAQIAQIGHDWSIFPNIVNVFSLTCGLWYHARPSVDNNPDKCVFDMFCLERIPPGAEPKQKKRHFKNWRDCEDLPVFLHDDFANIPEVQKGLKTRGFEGMRYNPLQELPITNLHRALDEFMGIA